MIAMMAILWHYKFWHTHIVKVYCLFYEREEKISKYNVVMELINVYESEVITEIEPLNSYFSEYNSTSRSV